MLVLCTFGVIAFLLPLKTAFLFGDDEGFEVIKPMLCNHGYTLYNDIWNDQPPLFTIILAQAFKLFGMTIFTARCVTVLFSLGLLASFYLTIYSYSGGTAATLSSLLLITSPTFLVLSVSAMLELPAFALGLAALYFLRFWAHSRRPIWVMVSGATLALACSIKLTVALLTPTMFLLLWFSLKGSLFQNWKPVLTWAASFLVSVGLIGVTWGRGSLESSWRSHTNARIVEHLKKPTDFSPNLALLGDHLESLIAAGVSLCLALRQRRIREIAVPISILATVTLVHAFHRPWWNYYYLHFAIPVAWLAGWALSILLSRLIRLGSEPRSKWTLPMLSQAAGLCLLLALPIARAERRLEGYFEDLNTRPALARNPIVAALRAEKPAPQWIYSESGIYPFHAGLLVDPHLAIIVPKRFWSGQISNHEILATLEKNPPAMIVLPHESITAQWLEFLQHGYAFVTNDANCRLYQLTAAAESSVSPPPPP